MYPVLKVYYDACNALQAGHVYICDLKILKDIPTRGDRYCTAPKCLLYVNGNDHLVPIAIQLKQEPSKDNPIFLPSDHWIDWLLAKTFYQCAHAQVSNSTRSRKLPYTVAYHIA